MTISTITPLSLKASVNLFILRCALDDLEHNHNFHISDGYWCCRACSISDAWECAKGKSYVFWHEQNEDELHESSNFEMPLYFGISEKSAKRENIVETARTIISVLEKHKLASKWSGDIKEAIIVKLDEHKPYQGEDFLWHADTQDYEANDPEEDLDIQEDHDFQWLYLWVEGLTMNELYEMNCVCSEPQYDDEPQNTVQIVLTIEDGKSTRSTFMQLPEVVRNHCTHFQRATKVGFISTRIEDINEINEMSLLALHKYLWLNLFACRETYQKSLFFNPSFINNNLNKTRNFLLESQCINNS